MPKYLHGHHPNPLRREFAELRRKGYKLVGEVAKILGVSQTTLRRMETEGVIPKAKRFDLARGKSVRAYGARDIERIARSSRANDGGRSIRGRGPGLGGYD